MTEEKPFEETREESSGPVLILEGQAEYSFYTEPEDVFVYSTGDYVEYMDELKGKADQPGFQDLLEERAAYKKEVHFENQD